MKVLSFGEILFDIIEGEPYLGGAPLNFAAHLAQLGVQSYIFSAVGKDALGSEALRQIEDLGVNTEFVQVKDEYSTGTVPVVFQNGQPDYTIVRDVAYDYIALNGNAKAVAKAGFDVLYYGTLAQRNEESRNTLKQLLENNSFKQVFYDINLRKDCFNKELIHESLQHCSMLKLNDEEVEVLSGMFFDKSLELQDFCARMALEYNLEVIVVTAGAKGCYILEGLELYFVNGYPAKVVDTVGAGDSFSAAFVYHYLKKGDALVAADIANRLGAFVASSRGPLPAYTPEIRRVLEL
ncbi:carbohydrate kinase [Cesiribacter sp. SM1]|uniref:carbohydrate kinase family protein n=1 Tax=Cesiribacter sp. SM1 TaxID=2861196 RepID=UPI001CD4867D|nr:carbohydrate kinase [Cesiribacter sp. SM1]